GNSPGILTVLNGIRFESDAVDVVDVVGDVDGYVPGQHFDQTVVQNGNLDLSGQPELRISVVGNVRSIPNNSLMIFDNRSSQAVQGSFRGLAEGSVFDLDKQGTLFRITYKGGDGND